MSLPTPTPDSRRATATRERSQRQGSQGRGLWSVWIIVVLALMGMAAAAVAGYQLGDARRVVPAWDPIWMRALLERPLDPGLPATGFWVAGYYVDYDPDSLSTLVARSGQLDQVVAFAHGVDRHGEVSGESPRELQGVIRGAKLILLFANIENGRFSGEAAARLLADPAARRRAIAGIVERLESLDAAGAQLDFEGIPPVDRDRFTAFVRELQVALADRGKLLSLAVPPKVNDFVGQSWNGAFDYAALGAIVDQLYIMAYDQHWSGGPPGPVAALPWTEDVVRYAVYRVPAGKVVLGLPVYGYDWGPRGGTAYGARRMAERMVELGATVRWHADYHENEAVYDGPDGQRVAWYPDGRTVAAKLRLARQYNLRGVAMWRLGLAADDIWPPLAAVRAQS